MPKVIVVDDDPANALLIQMLLELDGFSAVACTNLAQTHEAATEGADAFVVDVNLARGESGLDFLKAVRAGETAVAPDTTVIITSGDARRKREAMDQGATKFLVKPYPPENLSALLNKYLPGDQHG